MKKFVLDAFPVYSDRQDFIFTACPVEGNEFAREYEFENGDLASDTFYECEAGGVRFWFLPDADETVLAVGEKFEYGVPSGDERALVCDGDFGGVTYPVAGMPLPPAKGVARVLSVVKVRYTLSDEADAGYTALIVEATDERVVNDVLPVIGELRAD